MRNIPSVCGRGDAIFLNTNFAPTSSQHSYLLLYPFCSYDRRFPIGRTRMAELSVLACAAIMFVSTSLVIREAVDGLWDGFHGERAQSSNGTPASTQAHLRS